MPIYYLRYDHYEQQFSYVAAAIVSTVSLAPIVHNCMYPTPSFKTLGLLTDTACLAM